MFYGDMSVGLRSSNKQKNNYFWD